MGFTHFLRTEEGRLLSVLGRLPQLKRGYKSGFVSHYSHGRVHRFARRSQYIFNIGCKLWILASRDREVWSQLDYICVTSCIVSFYTHACRIVKRNRDVPENSNCQIVHSDMEVCTRIPGKCFRFIENNERKYWQQQTCTHTYYLLIRQIHTLEVHALCRYHRLPWVRHSASTAGNHVTHDRCNMRIETTNLTHKTQIVPLVV